GGGTAADPLAGSVCPFEKPPPGGGVNTVMVGGPPPATSVAGIDAGSCVELMKVVGRFEPSTRTTAHETQFVPLTVSVNAGSPAVLEFGLMLSVVGAAWLVPTRN